MFYLSSERSLYGASACVPSIRIHVEMVEKSQVKYRVFNIVIFIHDIFFCKCHLGSFPIISSARNYNIRLCISRTSVRGIQVKLAPLCEISTSENADK